MGGKNFSHHKARLNFREATCIAGGDNRGEQKPFKFRHIRGDSGGICIILGNDSMSDSKQKSSYGHGSDFERLRSYGHFLIPVHALM